MTPDSEQIVFDAEILRKSIGKRAEEICFRVYGYQNKNTMVDPIKQATRDVINEAFELGKKIRDGEIAALQMENEQLSKRSIDSIDYQKLFFAIGAAIKVAPGTAIHISVDSFRKTLNVIEV